jgi:hypothetical protein
VDSQPEPDVRRTRKPGRLKLRSLATRYVEALEAYEHARLAHEFHADFSRESGYLEADAAARAVRGELVETFRSAGVSMIAVGGKTVVVAVDPLSGDWTEYRETTVVVV